MTTSQPLALAATLAAVLVAGAGAQAPKPHALCSKSSKCLLSLDFSNNGQRAVATVGEQIELRLGTVGPQEYGKPQISSSAIRLESTALIWPPNPGGPTFLFIFTASTEGEALIMVPIDNADDPDRARRLSFSVRVLVRPGDSK